MHLETQIPSNPHLDLHVHPPRQIVYEEDKSPEPNSRRNTSLDSFAQVFSKALPTFQTVQEMTPVRISNLSTPVSETLYSDKSTNVSPDKTIETTEAEQVS